MSLDLPREIEQLAKRRAAESGFRDAAEYVAQLVAADARDADDIVEAAVLEGMGDDGSEWDLEAVRTKGRALLDATRNRGG